MTEHTMLSTMISLTLLRRHSRSWPAGFWSVCLLPQSSKCCSAHPAALLSGPTFFSVSVLHTHPHTHLLKYIRSLFHWPQWRSAGHSEHMWVWPLAKCIREGLYVCLSIREGFECVCVCAYVCVCVYVSQMCFKDHCPAGHVWHVTVVISEATIKSWVPWNSAPHCMLPQLQLLLSEVVLCSAAAPRVQRQYCMQPIQFPQ